MEQDINILEDGRSLTDFLRWTTTSIFVEQPKKSCNQEQLKMKKTMVVTPHREKWIYSMRYINMFMIIIPMCLLGEYVQHF
jgi:hypothetical protein